MTHPVPASIFKCSKAGHAGADEVLIGHASGIVLAKQQLQQPAAALIASSSSNSQQRQPLSSIVHAALLCCGPPNSLPQLPPKLNSTSAASGPACHVQQHLTCLQASSPAAPAQQHNPPTTMQQPHLSALQRCPALSSAWPALLLRWWGTPPAPPQVSPGPECTTLGPPPTLHADKCQGQARNWFPCVSAAV